MVAAGAGVGDGWLVAGLTVRVGADPVERRVAAAVGGGPAEGPVVLVATGEGWLGGVRLAVARAVRSGGGVAVLVASASHGTPSNRAQIGPWKVVCWSAARSSSE